MKNRDLFAIANITDDTKLKKELRENFAEWCKENNKTKLDGDSLADWLELNACVKLKA